MTSFRHLTEEDDDDDSVISTSVLDFNDDIEIDLNHSKAKNHILLSSQSFPLSFLSTVPSSCDACDLLDIAVSYEKQNDQSAAFPYWYRLYELNNSHALFRIGNRYYWGWNVPENRDRARECWLQSAQKGHQGAIAMCHYHGIDPLFSKDLEKSFQICLSITSNKSNLLMDPLLANHENDNDNDSYNIDIADEDDDDDYDIDITVLLALMYLNGYGTNKDVEKAMSLYSKSAYIHKHACSQYFLGWCLSNGKNGLSRDHVKGMDCYMNGAIQQHSWSQYYVGYCYEKGKGTNKNLDLARQWYQKAAEWGNQTANNAAIRLGPKATTPRRT